MRNNKLHSIYYIADINNDIVYMIMRRFYGCFLFSQKWRDNFIHICGSFVDCYHSPNLESLYNWSLSRVDCCMQSVAGLSLLRVLQLVCSQLFSLSNGLGLIHSTMTAVNTDLTQVNTVEHIPKILSEVKFFSLEANPCLILIEPLFHNLSQME